MRIICALLLLIAVIGCSGGSSEPAARPSDSPPPVQRAVENDAPFTLTMPSAWAMQAGLNDNADIQMGNPQREAYLIVLSESRSDFADEVTLAAYSDLTRTPLMDSLQDASETGPEDLEINGMKAIRYTLNGVIDNIKIKYWHVCVEGPKYYHQIIIWSLPSKFDTNEEDFKSALMSFKEKS